MFKRNKPTPWIETILKRKQKRSRVKKVGLGVAVVSGVAGALASRKRDVQ